MTRPDDAPDSEPRDQGFEAPAADAAEQSTPANPVEEPLQVRRGPEVGEWDAVEQAIVVDLEDEYDH
ncbi:MAG: hypothetical protein GEV12_02790 [Micromonosporaceae bacterium]|nr:hypothetical protein [Micromonosporaceae bacterium]